MNDNIILAVEDLSKTYIGDEFKVNALDNISFQLHKGEMIAIMGTSGSGKSTLLNILGALDKPTSGSIKLNGKYVKDIFIEPSASLYRQENIGFIFQSFNLLKDLSVEENISLPLILKNINKREITEKSNEIMNLLGLAKWKKHRPTQLSGGQQQRVAIGRAIITAPPIVLADEPTGNLDFNTSSEILHILVDMKRKFNQSILIVTHDANVATYADRVLFFHDGRIVDEYKCGDYDSLDGILEKFKKITERKDI
ncbi:putative ABC transport system ATP-binding protein [Bacillus sp. RC218]|uniref:ABC transporter ATP-binding protein n=1 Tax=Bacillus TaxID=1386 RepID=UPI0009921E87|nr:MULTISPECIES: ABC transporter ATP-binding protein [Bacillus cereus group]OOR15030.1 ABC transporter ATP-binding protein [Bacillus mycoides]QWG77731.1 ABC transporter ATP-binding protein [Bacillus mycoides]TXR80245.1 ABC transporter ATP-binding protein [Bacillus sp. AR13-1]